MIRYTFHKPEPLFTERVGLFIGITDIGGYKIKVGDTVCVRYWHGFSFTDTVNYKRKYAAYAIGDDLICEMEFDKGTTLEIIATC